MDASTQGLKRTSVLLGVLFLFAAGVQFNDPDPARWVLFYLVAAGISIFAAFRPIPWVLPGLLALVALVWLVVQAPAAVQSSDPLGELSRELAGQAMVLVWMSLLAWLLCRKRP